MELGVLGGSEHYPEFVITTITEFGVALEDKTSPYLAYKAAKSQIEAHKKARGKLCHDFVNGRCILCNTNTEVASSKLDTKPAAKDLTKSHRPIVETSIAWTKSRHPLQRIDSNTIPRSA